MIDARRLAQGLVAGAAGTAALHAVTYADIAVRGRPPSTTPEQTVARIAGLVRLPLREDDTRVTGIASLLGSAAGLGSGVLFATLRRRDPSWLADASLALVVAMLAGNGPMTILGVTDPRRWTREDWLTDLVPHLGYAAVAAAAVRTFDRPVR